ncbi:universal stress protein [Salinimonas sp. HHU 13199]|uniref:Universal stress protein n=1 Tax=Salinimonas profundi TaxID=2729140 RepID=A0ABR8LLI5_9ALTE|nr:universal stress protein [Salinimonas profundi]MBD3584945.1 universal stress protein [Salinimonas profundi]
MKSLKKLLVIVDEESPTADSKAIKCAIRLAKRNGATIKLIDVIQAPPLAVKMYQGIMSATDLTELVREKRSNILDTLATSIREDSLDVSFEVLEGRQFIEVIKRVLIDEYDLIIKSAHPVKESFDSSDFHLIRKCPCPVWLIKESRFDPREDILACIDLTQEESEEGQQLNRLILDLAASLASMEGVSLHVLTCWSLYGESMFKNMPSLGVNNDKLESMLQTTGREKRQQLQDILSDYQKCSTFPHLIKGQATDCIPAFINSHEFSTVVMGTVGRTGLPGFLIGNTSETVLSRIDSSVITVKPDGFETPVRQ